MSQSERLKALADAGVSIWLDDLDRDRITSGGLQELIETSSVSGVTTNPAIFNKAIGGDAGAHEDQLAEASSRGVSRGEAVRALTTADGRGATDNRRPVWEATNGGDGRVSMNDVPRV